MVDVTRKQKEAAFGEGWDAFCRGQTPRDACPYTAGTELAAWFAQGYEEAADGFSDAEAEVGDWKSVL